MPQGPEYLHRMFGNESNAWDRLRVAGYTQKNGVITPLDRKPTPGELCAIDYLCLEWDWAVEPRGERHD